MPIYKDMGTITTHHLVTNTYTGALLHSKVGGCRVVTGELGTTATGNVGLGVLGTTATGNMGLGVLGSTANVGLGVGRRMLINLLHAQGLVGEAGVTAGATITSHTLCVPRRRR